MKKIGKLKLNELSLEEQKLLKGGAVWDPATQSYLLPDVVVTPMPTLAYINPVYSDTDNELNYAIEAVINSGVYAIDAGIYLYNHR